MDDRRVRRPRVLLVSHAYTETTLQSHLVELARHVELRVVAPDRAKVLIFDDYRFVPTKTVAPILHGRRRLHLGGAQYVLATRDFGMRDFDPDIVHVDYEPWSTIFYQVLLARRLFRLRVPVLSSVKKNTYRRYSGLLGLQKRWLGVSGLRRSAAIVAASESAARLLYSEFGYGPERVRIATHIGVDVSVFSPAQRPRAVSSPPTVGYCGPLAAHKGVSDLVDAVSMLRREGLDIHLKVMGSGPLADDLQECASRHPWLTALGPVPNGQVPDFLRTLDVFVLPSRVLPDHQEHDAHALLEAFACGLPTVATESGIIPELLTPALGIVTRSQDPNALGSAIRTLVADPALRRRMSLAAREAAVNNYSSAVVASRKAAMYDALVRSHE